MAKVDDARAAAEDFLRFYLHGGAEAARKGTQLIEVTAAELKEAFERIDQAAPTSEQQSTIEPDPLEAFLRTPGIARRMPALIGPAPDFLAMPSTDLASPRSFPLDEAPLTPADGEHPLSKDDVYADMCAMEDAVVNVVGQRVEVSFLWVHDYPLEVLESAAVPDPSNLAEQNLPRLRALVDTAQPSIIASECMEALEAFLGPELFQELSFTWRVELCGFEALEATRSALLPP